MLSFIPFDIDLSSSETTWCSAFVTGNTEKLWPRSKVEVLSCSSPLVFIHQFPDRLMSSCINRSKQAAWFTSNSGPLYFNSAFTSTSVGWNNILTNGESRPRPFKTYSLLKWISTVSGHIIRDVFIEYDLSWKQKNFRGAGSFSIRQS